MQIHLQCVHVMSEMKLMCEIFRLWREMVLIKTQQFSMKYGVRKSEKSKWTNVWDIEWKKQFKWFE